MRKTYAHDEKNKLDWIEKMSIFLVVVSILYFVPRVIVSFLRF